MANRMKLFALVALSLVCGVLSLGGWQDVDLNNAGLNEVTNFAVKEYNKRGNDIFWSKLVRIQSASKQIVAGEKWKITFSLRPTRCLKRFGLQAAEQGNLQDCRFVANSQESTCNVVVYQPPLYHDATSRVPQLQSSDCNGPVRASERFLHPKKKTVRSLAGGPHPISDLNDELVQKAAKEAVKHINMRENSMYLKSLVEIQSGTYQIISGIRYTLKLKMGTSTCRKQSIMFASVEHCPLGNNPNVQTCTVNVDVGLGEDYCEVVDFHCGDLETMRRKRSVDENVNVFKMEQEHFLGGDTHDIHFGLFRDFKVKYSKVYKSEEEEMRRFAIFQENMLKVREIQKHERGTARYGATQFADLSEEEFRKNYLSPTWKADPTMKKADIPKTAPPPSFDWRDHKAVTEVKNQGSCGSCWAFSTTGNIEGQWFLKKKALVSLSEQELVDCDKVDQGCAGGLPSQAYKEIIKLGGLEGETDYPYKGRDEKCALVKSKVKVYINDSVTISKNETEIAAWLAANGPISIGINANAMQFYFGGIAHPWKIFCNPNNLDHGVLIVGYGTKGSEPYWIIKNSWGPGWGEKGYYLVYRGDGVCGLNTMCTSAVVR